MKRNAMRKNLSQSILKSLGRYIAIVAIIALGSSMFVGLLMTKSDMVATGQEFMDRQNMFDLRFLSSYGWTQDSVDAVSRLDGVADAEGAVSLDVIARMGESTEDAVYRFHSLPEKVNRVDLRGGRMPQRPDECLVDGYLSDDSYLGLTVNVSTGNEEDTLDALNSDVYTIVGYVATPLYMDMNRGTTSVGNGSIETYFYIPEDGFDVDYYSEINVTLAGEHEIYSQDYHTVLEEAAQLLEPDAIQIADARFGEIVDEAEEAYAEGYAEYLDGVRELEDGKLEAEQELADAYQQLADGEQELRDSEKTLADGEKQISKGWDTLAKNEKKLADSRKELEKVKKDAYSQLDEAQKELDDNAKIVAENLAQVEDGLAQVEDGLAQVEDGIGQLEDGLVQMDDGIVQLEDGLTQLDDGIAQLEDGLIQIDDGIAQLEEMMPLMEAAMKMLESMLDSDNSAVLPDTELMEQLRTELQNLRDELSGYTQKLDELYAMKETYTAQLEELKLQREECTAQLEELKLQRETYAAQLEELYATRSELLAAREELLAGKAELEEAQAAIDDGYAQLKDARAEADARFADAEAQLTDGEKQLQEGKQTLRDKEKELADGRKAIADGWAEIKDGWQEYFDGKAEAEAEIADGETKLADAEAELADARADIDAMEKPELYILDRTTNVGYTSLDSASDIVQGVARVFPAFFLLVAALVCITTMTRMIDEERTQIGTLKALGYSSGAIISKYLIYAGSGAIVGCGLGVLVGSVAFPAILWEAYKIMLFITDGISLKFNWLLCGAVVGSYTTVMLLVTWYCCRKALREEPAELIRPKAPEAGRKILLEYLPFWHKISFLNKVTIRNIFRYRQRLAMMLVGIGGCTALLVTGFGLRDSIVNVVDYQFRDVTVYDMTVYFSEALSENAREEFRSELKDEPVQMMFYHQSSIELDYGDKTRELYLIAADRDVEKFMHFRTGDQQIPCPETDEVLLSVGIANIMDLAVGDKVTLRNSDMQTLELTVSGIYDNYVNNYAVISPDTIKHQWGEEAELQMAFVKVDEGQDVYELSARIAGMDSVMNVSVSEDLASMVGNLMKALDLVVWVVVFCAGALAAIVLYNLTNININERIREIATIKVLGFRANESAMYVFKENLSLTGVGAVLGLGLGYLLLVFVMSQIKIDFVWFKTVVTPQSYLWALVLTVLAAIIVDFIFYFRLDKINMAEALKSVE